MDALCAFATGNGEKLNTDGVDRQKLVALSDRHSVAGIVSYVIHRFGLFENEEIRETLSTRYEKTLSVMLRRSLAAENLSRNFSKLNIPHIPFKGSSVAKYYPVSELRAYSDVDMIVKEKDVATIDSFMKEKGFSRSVADEGIVTCYKKGMEYYEIHTALNIPDDEAMVFSAVWENSELSEGSAYRLNESFHLCYLISHLEKHMRAGGAGIKMYLDIALILRNAENLDFSYIKEKLKESSLYPFFETVLRLCQRWFETEIPFDVAPLDEEIYEKLCSFTLSQGVYGDHTKEGVLESSLARVSSESGKCSKLRFLLKKVFPSNSELYRVFPKYEGRPVSARFAHLFSFVNKEKRKNIRNVMKVDVKAADSRRDFLSSIGCK